MKRLILIFLFLNAANLCAANIEGAVDYYLTNYGHDESNEELLIAQVDFDADGSPEVLLAFSETSHQKYAYNWTVLQIKNGVWLEPKTLDISRETKDFGLVSFDPDTAGFMVLEKIERPGVLAYVAEGEYWEFFHLDNGIIKSIIIKEASEIGKTDEELKQLCIKHRIQIERRAVKTPPSR